MFCFNLFFYLQKSFTEKKTYHTKSKLVTQYEKAVLANKDGLMEIANALNNIAQALDSGLASVAHSLLFKETDEAE